MATGNVLVHGGFKIRDGVNRSHDGNLVLGARLADPQVAGFDSTALTNNIAVNSNGEFCERRRRARTRVSSNPRELDPA